MSIHSQVDLDAMFPRSSDLGRPTQITTDKIKMLLDSLVSVGGALHGSDVTAPITGAWSPFTGYSSSVDTKGVDGNPATGVLTIQEGAEGLYLIDVMIALNAAAAANADLSISKNGSLTTRRSRIIAGQALAVIHGGLLLAAGDTVGLAWRSVGNANVEIAASQFRIHRA